jgi:glutaminyl-peptide cyclotransferase
MTLPLKSIAAPVALALLLTACGPDRGAPSVDTIETAPAIAHLTVDVRNTVEHDSNAFTQGLVFADGALYESTGKYGRSELRQVAIDSAAVLRSTPLDANLFGEGLAHVDDRLIQLTWKSGRALVYDRDRLSVIDEFAYEGEGWGLCFDGNRLVMSDGSSTLTFRDPESFDVLGTVDVTQAGSSVTPLNELECVDGSVYANVWRTDRIVRIDPSSGQVKAEIDAASLERSPAAGVLNGIAYDPASGFFRLTGKSWSAAYDVEFVERE